MPTVLKEYPGLKKTPLLDWKHKKERNFSKTEIQKTLGFFRLALQNIACPTTT